MTDAAGPERLIVLAALLDHDPDCSRIEDAWVRADGSPADTALIDSATPEEWDLATAVRGEAMNDADTQAITALLRLADGSPLAGALRIALRETFLDRVPADRLAAFADLYARFALPGLAGVAREQAEHVLTRLK